MIKKIFHVKKKKKSGILPDDIFIVSYPRSGNTWLRFVLANLLYKDRNINFTNIHKFCPEVGKLNDFHSRHSIPRLIKSHDCYNPIYPKVIYLVRDGRDVYVSYYHYLSNNLSSEMTFKKFLEKFQMPYGRWNDHVLSWMKIEKPLLIIKYEEMYSYSIATVHKVLDFINIKLSEKHIKMVLEKTTFKQMKELEIKYGRGKHKSGPDTFMRKGEIGGWQNYFGKDERSIFKKKENIALVKLHYEKDSNW